jgi:hypothetical protein
MTKPLLHFCHGNSFPSGTYRQLLDALGAHYEVRQTDMVGHDPRYPVDDNWSKLVDELIADSSATASRRSWSAIRSAACSARWRRRAGRTWRAAW